MFSADSNPSIGGSVNSATKFARTCHFTEVRGMYLMSKARRIVPPLGYPSCVISTSEYGFKRKLSKNDNCMCLEVMRQLTCTKHYCQDSFLLDIALRPHAVTYSHNKLAVVRHNQLLSIPSLQHKGPQQCRQKGPYLARD